MEKLEYFLDKRKVDFDVIGISKSRIKTEISLQWILQRITFMNLAPGNLLQVALCYTLVIILPINLEMTYVFINLQS